ncbi:N-formylglutamate amidohydrolase [Litoreibacter arenae]|uniref:Riorf59 protein n=1 Tax=Litoreibacter arenae DSM 19593 TaxID=1123360 RepID=S9RHN4_9RHOB|nr:N-formylglutamate amidohydrolase [Litoreibacter arenae]EPX77585.1 Riorf59 protein [Litoreibacter arenae DSM 19593]
MLMKLGVRVQQILPSGQGVVVNTVRGASDVVLVCEHASAYIPPALNNLGLREQDRLSHAAWDIGALAVAERMARIMDATLVSGAVSRLVYDCNRPPDAPDAMPERSERIAVPGNVGLSASARAERVATYYQPFRQALGDAISACAKPAIVTIHSFTPLYHGKPREVEIGLLHDSDSRLADAMLALAPGHTVMNTQRNAPYGPEDGVTHTLKEHALPGGHLNVMIEVRNDLIATKGQQDLMAEMLSDWTSAALEKARGDHDA